MIVLLALRRGYPWRSLYEYGSRYVRSCDGKSSVLECLPLLTIFEGKGSQTSADK